MIKTLRITVPLTLALLLSACGKDVPPSTVGQIVSIENLGSAQGNFRLIATDAPFQYADVTSAKVTVDKIEAEDVNEVRKVVKDTPMTIDLVQLRNGLVTAMVDLNLSPGQYKKIILTVSNGSIGLKDGSNTNLKNPSSEIKVSIKPEITVSSSMSTDVILDFDLSKSFVLRGNDLSDGFNFKPVLRAANLTTAGTVSGKVLSDKETADLGDDVALEGAIVTISQDGSSVSTALTGADGKFKVVGLPAGEYSFVVSHPLHSSSQSSSFSIAAGNVTSAGDTLLVKTPTQTP